MKFAKRNMLQDYGFLKGIKTQKDLGSIRKAVRIKIAVKRKANEKMGRFRTKTC